MHLEGPGACQVKQAHESGLVAFEVHLDSQDWLNINFVEICSVRGQLMGPGVPPELHDHGHAQEVIHLQYTYGPYPWFLYQMVAHFTLRTNDENKVLFRI